MYKCKCGADGKTENETFFWIARCTTCDNQTALYDSKENAIKEWNRINRAAHLAVIINSLLDEEIEKHYREQWCDARDMKMSLKHIDNLREAIFSSSKEHE